MDDLCDSRHNSPGCSNPSVELCWETTETSHPGGEYSNVGLIGIGSKLPSEGQTVNGPGDRDEKAAVTESDQGGVNQDDTGTDSEIITMINTLLDEDSNEMPSLVEALRAEPIFDSRENSFAEQAKVNYEGQRGEQLSRYPCSGDGRHIAFADDSFRGFNANSDHLQAQFRYRNYRPPSHVRVQINCNGQQTITSASLQDFRRLIGLRGSPRKSVIGPPRTGVPAFLPANGRGLRNNRANISRNALENQSTHFLGQQVNIQNQCAARFAFRFGRHVCDELKNCLLSLRKVSASREICESYIALKPWMRQNSDYLRSPTAAERCCMVDWLMFEFLKEYCNTDDVLKCLDQVWGMIADSNYVLGMMKYWLNYIRSVDRHRRSGFCECSAVNLSVTPSQAYNVLHCLNQSTIVIGDFLATVIENLASRFGGRSVLMV